MSELLPCPFCVSTNLNLSHINEIWCKDCDAGVHLDDYSDNTKQSTIDSWNKRSLTAHMKWIEKIEAE